MIRKSTWIIVLLFVALLGATILWQRSQKEKAADATPTAKADTRLLFDLSDKIAFLRLERVGDRQVELQLDAQGAWQLTWPEGMQVDTNALDPVLAQLAALSVVSTLDQPPALDVLGLDKPAYRLLIKLADGKQALANVGKETPTGSGYYVLSGDRQIVVVDKAGLDGVLKLIDTPPVMLTPVGTETGLPVTATP